MALGEFDDDLDSDFQSDDGSFVIDPERDLPPEQDEELGDLGGEEPKPTRDEKKRARYDELQSKLDAAEQRLAQMEQRVQYQQFAPPTHNQQPLQNPEEERIQAALKENDSRRLEIERLFSVEQKQGMSEERQRELRDQYAKVQDQREELRLDLREIKRRPSPERVAQYNQQMQLQVMYPDIVGDEQMFNYASALTGMERAKNPQKVFTKDDWDRIAEETRVALGRKSQPVSDATKARHSGYGTGGNGAGGAPQLQARLNQMEMQMAMSLYRDEPNLTPKQKAAKYWREVLEPQRREEQRTG